MKLHIIRKVAVSFEAEFGELDGPDFLHQTILNQYLTKSMMFFSEDFARVKRPVVKVS
jgi:hypothetical protein